MPPCASSLYSFHRLLSGAASEGGHSGGAYHNWRGTTEFTVSGYADNTAVYLRDRSAIMPVITILDDFSHVSGLRMLRSSALPLSTCGLTLQSPGDSCRYLGVLVGQQDAVADKWNKCIRSLWSRLVLAREKTHTVERRAKFASAIAVSRITFLARHCWPPPAMDTRLHSLIVDFVWGVWDGKLLYQSSRGD